VRVLLHLVFPALAAVAHPAQRRTALEASASCSAPTWRDIWETVFFQPARGLVRTFAIGARSSLSKTYVLTTALCERLMDALALVLWEFADSPRSAG